METDKQIYAELKERNPNCCEEELQKAVKYVKYMRS